MIKHREEIYKKELLDLYGRVDDVLTNSQIKHFALFGTCIGAMREGGIIPWDGDIDLGIMRGDFDRAVAELKNSSANLYVCSTHGQFVKGRLWRVFNRIAEDDSIEKKRAYIDIYVLDHVVNSYFLFRIMGFVFIGLRRIMERRSGFRDIYRHPFVYFTVDALLLPFNVLSDRILLKIMELLYVLPKQSDYVRIGSFKRRYPAKWFSETIRVPFDNMTMCVPNGYDQILSHYFGDWRTPPPVSERQSNTFAKNGEWSVELPPDEDRRK